MEHVLQWDTDEMYSLTVLQDVYRSIRKYHTCGWCNRQHHPGDIMQYTVAVVAGFFQHGWFCAGQCSDDIEQEKPPWSPAHPKWI